MAVLGVSRTLAQRMRSTLLVAATAAVVGIAANSVAPTASGAASTSTALGPKTYIYTGGKRVGYVQTYAKNQWRVWCEAYYNGAYEIRRKNGITLYDTLEHPWGTARLQRAGRWVVNGSGSGVLNADQHGPGMAIRVGPRRWNALVGHRIVGHTRGPDGPEAASALLVVCSS